MAGVDGVVVVEDAMRAMSAADTAVRETAIVALLGRLRPILPAPGRFLADVVAGVLALSAPPFFFRGGFPLPLTEPWAMEIISWRGGDILSYYSHSTLAE